MKLVNAGSPIKEAENHLIIVSAFGAKRRKEQKSSRIIEKPS
jgi:hypothetical protein